MRTLLAVFSRNIEPMGALIQRSVLVEASALPCSPADFASLIGQLNEPGWHLVSCQLQASQGADSRPFVVLDFAPLPMSGGHAPTPRAGWRRWFSRKSPQ